MLTRHKSGFFGEQRMPYFEVFSKPLLRAQYLAVGCCALSEACEYLGHCCTLDTASLSHMLWEQLPHAPHSRKHSWVGMMLYWLLQIKKNHVGSPTIHLYLLAFFHNCMKPYVHKEHCLYNQKNSKDTELFYILVMLSNVYFYVIFYIFMFSKNNEGYQWRFF